MALITCSKCNKTISDRAEKCIHCGAPIVKILPNNELSPVKAIEAETQEETKEPKIELPKYTKLPLDDQMKLENEFVKSNKKAQRIRRAFSEIGWYKKLSTIGFIAFGLIAAFIFIAVRIVPMDDVQNEDLMGTAVALWLVLLASSIGLAITSSVCRSMYNRSQKEYIYWKLYQTWLLKEKQLDFTPRFQTQQEQEIFNKIDLDKIN